MTWKQAAWTVMVEIMSVSRGDVEAGSVDIGNHVSVYWPWVPELLVFPDAEPRVNNQKIPCCESLCGLMLHGGKVY